MLFAAIISTLMLSTAGDTLLSPAQVTAFKERVPLEEVASPVSVILPADIKAEGIIRQEKLSAMVPGLMIPEYGASLTSTVYLRGVGSRMENPSMGLYVDGIPIMDKNAYDFDWTGISFAALMRGPGATLYGRNSMSGTLVLQSLSPGENNWRAYLEAGSAMTLQGGFSLTTSRHAISLGVRHRDGFFDNEFKDEKVDPYNGLSLRWKWMPAAKGHTQLSNSLFATLSKEGGFAYGLYEDGVLNPVAYDGEGSYRRLSIIDGLSLSYQGDGFTLDGTASLQFLSDDMRMDQDFTPQPVFTMQQKQDSGTGTLELILRGGSGRWKHSTGLFAFYKHNKMHAPVTFGRDGIETLILDNANRNIPEDIGFLSIPDDELLISSDFRITTAGAALFHESVLSLGRWRLTAGLRVDYEGGKMTYDCLTALNYRFVPTMNADKAVAFSYTGSTNNNSRVRFLPKISALYEAGSGVALFGIVSRGFRAGGFNTQIFSDILQNQTMNGLMKDLGVYLDKPAVSVGAEDTCYKPETAWNYEAGLRYSKGNFRAEASLYYMDVRNQQLTVFPPGKSTGRMMTNAGRSRSIGAEGEMDWQPGKFHFHASYSWCNARFVRFNDGNNDYSDNRVPYTPEHTIYASAAWRHKLKGATLNLGASVRAYGPLYWDEAGNLCESVHIRPAARVSLAFPKWGIWLRGENLTGSSGRNFYFKSVGREFFSRERSCSIVLGISVHK